MAKENHITIPAHYNIYTGKNTNRNLDIYFTEPQLGVNKETGLLLLIPGFRGNVHSKVYKKMRLDFADKYNLIVIQCNYFGSEFMQNSNKIRLTFDINKYQKLLSADDFKTLKKGSKEFNSIIGILSKYSCELQATEIMDENKDLFNDMGFMQAMDLLTALYAVKLILADNKLTYNNNKVIAYGYSHGAYLAYLCNRLAPNDFSLIIDNSGWISPVYINSFRYLHQSYGKMILHTRFDYLAKKINYDKEILDLRTLYNQFENQAQIWCFQGKNDHLVNYREKQDFCKSIGHSNFRLIDDEHVDNKIFYTTAHGLNANFLELFYYAMEKVDNKSFAGRINHTTNTTCVEYLKIKYKVYFQGELPFMSIEKVL